MENFNIEIILIYVATIIILILACTGGLEMVDGVGNRVACIEVCKGQPVESSARSCMCKDGLKERYVQSGK